MSVPGDDPGDDEFEHGVTAHREERVDLIRHLHGPEFGADAGPDASGEHDRREHRPQLGEHAADHAARDDLTWQTR